MTPCWMPLVSINLQWTLLKLKMVLSNNSTAAMFAKFVASRMSIASITPIASIVFVTPVESLLHL
jgi:hypothetical protein